MWRSDAFQRHRTEHVWLPVIPACCLFAKRYRKYLLTVTGQEKRGTAADESRPRSLIKARLAPHFCRHVATETRGSDAALSTELPHIVAPPRLRAAAI